MSQTIANRTQIPKGRGLLDLVNNEVMHMKRDVTTHPRNEYTPDFVTSLNFNFNTNDIFGTRGKKAINTNSKDYLN